MRPLRDHHAHHGRDQSHPSCLIARGSGEGSSQFIHLTARVADDLSGMTVRKAAFYSAVRIETAFASPAGHQPEPDRRAESLAGGPPGITGVCPTFRTEAEPAPASSTRTLYRSTKSAATKANVLQHALHRRGQPGAAHGGFRVTEGGRRKTGDGWKDSGSRGQRSEIRDQPQPTGVRPSPGAATSEGSTVPIVPRTLTVRALLRPGTGALRKRREMRRRLQPTLAIAVQCAAGRSHGAAKATPCSGSARLADCSPPSAGPFITPTSTAFSTAISSPGIS